MMSTKNMTNFKKLIFSLKNYYISKYIIVHLNNFKSTHVINPLKWFDKGSSQLKKKKLKSLKVARQTNQCMNRQMNEQMDICECRVAFATEKIYDQTGNFCCPQDVPENSWLCSQESWWLHHKFQKFWDPYLCLSPPWLQQSIILSS